MVTDALESGNLRLPRMEQDWETGTFWKCPILTSLRCFAHMCVLVQTHPTVTCEFYPVQMTGVSIEKKRVGKPGGEGLEVLAGPESFGCEDSAC